jgi:hypothetical protein
MGFGAETTNMYFYGRFDYDTDINSNALAWGTKHRWHELQNEVANALLFDAGSQRPKSKV